MAGPFSIENPGVAVTYSVDVLGNVFQNGNLTVNGTTTSGATTNNGTTVNNGPSTFNGTATFSSVIVESNGINSSGSVSYLATLGIAAGTGGTQLADTTRDYQVYLTVTTAGGPNTILIGAANPPVSATITAMSTVNLGHVFSFRLPAGWYVRWAGTAGITTQNAVSC
jgi:hypothetical protein